jgi:hypothetical protein
MKHWTHSRIVWSALGSFALGFLSLLDIVPKEVGHIFDFGTMCFAVLTVWFRFTTTTTLQR